ncbi:MAG: undecaprenyl/decaprenyl-phosphate alpha-N-acetylglucosaminyl 1-phosphate transferase [Candidatus Omnitrophica bacterium]|nr:undecaprenyl/decaprenyl-phosphate alpha-N-acetylglucosaminyl 1-phosphate transferase [Candidatus Omnitrophota bacterium]
MNYLLIFAVAATVTLLITPSIRYLALKFSIIDRKKTAKDHNRIVTRFGGIAIYIGFMFAMLTAFITEFSLFRSDFIPFAIIILVASLILILGICDDAKGVSPRLKFAIQILAALILIKSGFIVRMVSNPFGGPIKLGIFAVPFTMLWLVGITNAINLIDGLDGLAAGIVLISSLGLFFIFLVSAMIIPAFFAMALAGSCLGFLRNNFPPAKVFMGDTGSLFLGFSLASLATLTSHKATASIALLVPIIGLGLPILDTSLSFFRRLVKKTSPFKRDKLHIHHLLLKRRNLTEKQLVLILWSITLFLNIFACSLFLLR